MHTIQSALTFNGKKMEMKNQYVIVKHTANGDLFYNDDYNFFSGRFKSTYTSRKSAQDKVSYAKKYASNGNDVIEVIKLF